jgi:hypothetical protein
MDEHFRQLHTASDKELEELDSFDNNPHFALGSRLAQLSFDDLSHKYVNDVRFHQFRERLARFVNRTFKIHKVPLPDGQPVKFQSSDLVCSLLEYCLISSFASKIRSYQFLRVNYESLVDWRQTSDYLRCNPNFYNHPRYDFVLVPTPASAIFGQLILIFSCGIGDQQHPFALIQPYEVVGLQQRSARDKVFGLMRIRKKRETEFISMKSVIRGALAAPVTTDPAGSTDRFIVDVVDPDMFLRVKRVFPGQTDTFVEA